MITEVILTMNKLLKMSFDRYGYDYDFLTNIHKSLYSGNYMFQDEGQLVLALKNAHDRNSVITIIPDFDMDGISAGVIFYAGLSLLGFNVHLYAPDVTRGYGFDICDIDNIMTEWPDTEILLTCDVGVTCHDAVTYACEHNLRVLVTDHHIEKTRVGAELVVDPCRNDSDCDFTGVCGAFVAYHVLSLYASCSGNAAMQSLISHLAIFASLGSCGDLMPVIHDTRAVIKTGVEEFNNLLDAGTLDRYFGCDLKYLPDAYVAPFENLCRFHFWLMDNNYIQPGRITEVTYGFTYCPVFNSVKRMGSDMKTLYEFLYTRFEFGSERFNDLCTWLWELNQTRKQLVQEYFSDLIEDPGQIYAPFIYITDAIPGILGLLAMKITQTTGLPVFVVTKQGDIYSGSGRTPSWLPCSILNMQGVQIDGHAHAFGISITDSEINTFFDYVKKYTEAEQARALLDVDVSASDPRLVLCLGGHSVCDTYDFSIVSTNDYDVCVDYTYEIEKFRPFGAGFVEPEFILKFTRRDIYRVSCMGALKNHLRIDLAHNIRAVFFNGVDQSLSEIEQAIADDDFDHVFCFSGRFTMNHYNGHVTLQFLISSQIC